MAGSTQCGGKENTRVKVGGKKTLGLYQVTRFPEYYQAALLGIHALSARLLDFYNAFRSQDRMHKGYR